MSPTPEQVKELRAQAQLTQAQAAELLGVTLKGFQHWEYGVRKMPEPAWRLFKLLARSEG